MAWWLIALIVYGIINLGITIWALISLYDYFPWNFWEVVLGVVILMIFGVPIVIYGLILEIIEK